MGTVNPFFPVSMAFEVADALRRAGEKDEALTALARAVSATKNMPLSTNVSTSPLWNRMTERLDPSRSGEAWAEHKARQLDDLRRTLCQSTVARVATPEWQELAGDDPRYQEILSSAERLANEEVAG